VTSPTQDRRRPAATAEPASINEIVDLVKSYAQQETVEPLKGAGRWLGVGAAGALAFGIGGILILLGLLRLLQTEWERSASGALSWLSYLIVLVVGALVILVAASRIKKDSLEKHGK
jgi:Putative Actinobacterial Holin-X, holin superfamily III